MPKQRIIAAIKEIFNELEGCVDFIITSRIPFIENFKGYRIENKSIEECRKIFEMYYNAPCNIEEDIFKNLIEYIEQVCDIASSAYLPHSGKSRLGCEAGAVMKFVFIPFVYCWRAGT